MDLKKKIMVLFASVLMLVSASPLVMATTPEPAGNSEEAQVTMAPAANTAVQTQTTSFENDKYLTKGGAAFWFIFTIVLNGALSFWVGNRFYRMSKKDTHVSAEIRALRKDIDEKFAKNVGGFAEQEIDITNLNESLDMDDEGIKLSDRSTSVTDITPEEAERFRRWEEAQSRPRTERPRVKSAVKEELEDDFDRTRKINRKNYQPKRDNADDFVSDDSEDLGETREVKVRSEGVKTKAKEILSDIFPFKED